MGRKKQDSQFGDNLRMILKNRMMKQCELAKELDVHFSTVSGWMTKGYEPDKDMKELICIALDCTMEELEGKEMVQRETTLNRNASAIYDPTAGAALKTIQAEEIKRGEVWKYQYNTQRSETKNALVLNVDGGYIGITMVAEAPVGNHWAKIDEYQYAVCDRITFAQRDRFFERMYEVAEEKMQLVNKEIAEVYCGNASILETYKEVEELREIIREREEEILEKTVRIEELKARNAELINAARQEPEYDVARLEAERNIYKEQYENLLAKIIGDKL